MWSSIALFLKDQVYLIIEYQQLQNAHSIENGQSMANLRLMDYIETNPLAFFLLQ